jgi:hypothetical protein
MWSDRYNYYNIQYDLNFSGELSNEIIIKAIIDSGHFEQVDHQTFRNKMEFPWANISVHKTDSGNYSSSDIIEDNINLIAIVCGKNNGDDKLLKDTFLKIAKKLNWKLYLEEDDNENENVEIK